MIFTSDNAAEAAEKIEARRTRAASKVTSAKCMRHGMGIVHCRVKKHRGVDHAIVRLIFVRVVPEEAKNAEQIWKESCAPLLIQQSGCLSEKLLRSSDDAEEFISYSEWKD